MQWWRGGRYVLYTSWLLLALGGLAFFIAISCSSGEESPSNGLVIEQPTPTPEETVETTAPPIPTATATPIASPTPTIVPTSQPTLTPLPSRLSGFTMPIQGACLPSSDNLMPNAPRAYRAGVHEGIDFYNGYVCVPIAKGTPVVAAKEGTVTRADLNYQSPTADEIGDLLAKSQAQGFTDEVTLDILRGRQVWVQHAEGVVTRYAHLDDIAPGIRTGTPVAAGTVIGYVGNSGILEGILSPTAEIHLHFEIRDGGTYVGRGMAAAATRQLLTRMFAP